MNKIHRPNIYNFYTTKLDEKGRCAFPSELRDGKRNIPVYIFYSPQHKRAMAILDKKILSKQFPDDFEQLPLQKMTINEQGKLYLGPLFSRSTGVQLSKKQSIHFMRAGKNGDLIEIYFSDEDLSAAIQLREKIADKVMSALLNPESSRYHFVTKTAYSPLLIQEESGTLTMTS